MNRILRHSEQSATQRPGKPSTFSANWLRRLSGSILLPLGGRLGGGFLLFLLLLVGSRYAIAQNTGATPYVNSWHTYRVVVGDPANNREWDITNGGSTTYTLDGTQTWDTIHTLSGNNADISIYFDDAFFNAGQTWYLRYREKPSGSNVCTASRQFTILLSTNNFYLTLNANDTICKTESGTVYNWNDVDNELFNTAFTYRVTLHKEAGLILKGWSFEANIGLVPVATHSFINYSVAVVSVGEGIATLNDGGVYSPDLDGIFKVNVEQPFAHPDSITYSVDVTVTVNGILQNGVTATLNLLNGKANSGITGPIVTDDNTGRPTAADGVTDVLLQDRQKVMVVNPLPATLNILAGAGETAWSSQHPLQMSTHRYTVPMSNRTDNFNNAGTGWSIKRIDGTPIVAGFTLTQSPSLTNDTAKIDFTSAMFTGRYVLYYTEINDNGCSAVREFPFTLEDPFDVDLEPIDSTCAWASGQIFAGLAPTSTTIEYTVNLDNADYDTTWSFHFEVTDPSFGADLDVANLGDIVVTSGGTYTPVDKYSGDVKVPKSVTEVKIHVTYTGIYSLVHSIKASLTNITGGYNEIDEDADDHIVHVIKSMPHIILLAGVE